MTEVVDVLAAVGARVDRLVEAAAVGDVDGWLTPEPPPDERVLALIMAADHQRRDVVDALLARDPVEGRTALEWCRRHNQADGTRHEAAAALLAPVTPG